LPLFESDHKTRGIFRTLIHNQLVQHRKFNPYTYAEGGLHRKITSFMRKLPDFLIIGAGKCGTSSLYYYLIQHDNILSARQKEIHFFDINYDKGINWYRSQLPLFFHKRNVVTGEASPFYMYDPSCPPKVFKHIPKVKLIVLLRDPIERAYSHYQHSVRRGYEKLSFEEAIENEESRLNTKDFTDLNHGAFSYISRGLYSKQIKKWLEYFPKEQFLFIKTENFLENPKEVMKQSFKFLNLKNQVISNSKKMNVGEYTEMNKETRHKLEKIFKPHNNELSKLLDSNFQW